MKRDGCQETKKTFPYNQSLKMDAGGLAAFMKYHVQAVGALIKAFG